MINPENYGFEVTYRTGNSIYFKWHKQVFLLKKRGFIYTLLNDTGVVIYKGLGWKIKNLWKKH